MIDDHHLKPDLTFTATHKDDVYGREALMRYIKSLDMALAISNILRNDSICDSCYDIINDILNSYGIHIDELIS